MFVSNSNTHDLNISTLVCIRFVAGTLSNSTLPLLSNHLIKITVGSSGLKETCVTIRLLVRSPGCRINLAGESKKLNLCLLNQHWMKKGENTLLTRVHPAPSESPTATIKTRSKATNRKELKNIDTLHLARSICFLLPVSSCVHGQ